MAFEDGLMPDEEVDVDTMTERVVNDCLFTVIHNLVLETHKKEKELLQTLDPETNLPLCQKCGLPRLLDPPLAISRPTKSTQYCSAIPWSKKPGHDIYGNPFPVAGSDKPPTKKEREARAKAEREERKNGGKNKDKDKDEPDSPSKDEGPNLSLIHI